MRIMQGLWSIYQRELTPFHRTTAFPGAFLISSEHVLQLITNSLLND